MIPAGFTFLAAGLLFAVMTLGLAWPLVARTQLDPAEKIVATAALSLLGIFLLGWLGFAARWSVAPHWILPVLALAGLGVRWRELRALWADAAARELLLGQLGVSLWVLGWLAWVRSYSGGGWAGDWFEHWERARFILERGPPDTLFLGHATFTARPPLANVVTAVWLSLTRADFAHYQFFTTLLGSLAFAPAALFARRLGGTAAIPVTALLFLLNPMFVQNATFAWTKLPTVFFVLGAVWFFLHARSAAQPILPALLCAAALAGGILTHYSAGPFAVVLAAAWLTRSASRRADPAWWRATAAATALGGVLLATWFGWAFAVYGTGGTLLANTSVTTVDSSFGGQLTRIALNLRDTFVPHFLRSLDTSLIAQRSPWGDWRDWFFQSYQTNLFLALGSVAWLALAAALRPLWRDAARGELAGWAAAIGATVFLGIAVHGARDTWGLTHICLQPVVLLGLAGLGGRAAFLSRPWRLLLVAGAAVDFALGVFLHYGTQAFLFDRWFTAGRPIELAAAALNPVAAMNLAAKAHLRAVFFADAIALPLWAFVAWPAAAFALVVWRIQIRATHAR
jgi:hypothetical protein